VEKVEPQSIGSDERALLYDVVAQDTPERRVQQVSRGMVPFGIATGWLFDLRPDGSG
jgi:hypothetical protein